MATSKALLIVILCGTALVFAQDEGFPNTKRLGKAIVQYRDKQGLQVVLSYEYSQRNHATPWLLIDFGARADQPVVLDREHFTLVGSTGDWVPVASQRHFLEAGNEIRSLRQNAAVWRRPLDNYLGARDIHEPLKFFALPGEGVIITGALLDRDRITLGELYFEKPVGSWDSGEYALLIEHPQVRVKLPITLE